MKDDMSTFLTEDEYSKSIEGEEKLKNISYFKLFKYASSVEIFLIIIGCLASVLVGASMPVSFFFFSDLINELIDVESLSKTLDKIITIFAILGAVTFFIAFVQMFCLQLSAKLQSKRIRYLFYKMILRQDVAWFDAQSPGKLITHLTEGIDKIESGIGEKLGIFIQYILIFVSGIGIGFIKNWELSLVACASFPLVIISIASFSFVNSRYATKERAAYSAANSIAGEVLGAIKTIFAFEGQEKELARYEGELGKAERLGIRKSSFLGLSFGSSDCSIYILIAITIWYGVAMLQRGDTNSGDIILVVFAMLFGSATLGQSFQQIDYFNTSKIAATKIFEIIDRVPPVDKLEPGQILNNLTGEISFKNVSFSYPMRTDSMVLSDLTLKIKRGQTVAIVGPSGSGKSTIIQLIQRFYDVDEGEVCIDGVNIRELDLKWFRSKLGVVSQEPVLFSGTISENIRLGNLDASQEEIEAAAKLARVHDFVQKLPEAYETFIGEGGGGMSGGQKQRIAIARALVRNPQILLLDEATSALDLRSEKSVQKALDNAKQGRTVVIVAHRLSTVRDADVIMVMDGGKIREIGNHQQLLAKKGIYAQLISKGKKDAEEEVVESDSDFDDDEIIEEIVSKSRLSKQDIGEHEDAKSIASSVTHFLNDNLGVKFSPTKEVLRLNKPEAGYMLLGCSMAVLGGLVQASFTIVYTEVFDIFQQSSLDNSTENKAKQMERTMIICIVMIVLGLLRVLGLGLGGFAMGVAGERLTKRCRIMYFKTILNQEVGWFDEPENQPGALTGRLAAEVPKLQNVSGRRLSSILEMFVLIVTALVISFVFSWQIALVALAFFPVLMIVGAFQMQQWAGDGQNVNFKGAALAQETFVAARTVFSLGAEDYFSDKYAKEALAETKKLVRASVMFSLMSALANSMMNFEFAAAFYAGGILIEKNLLSLMDVMRSYTAISFAAQNLGAAAAFAPDTKKASEAAKHIFGVFYREPLLTRNEGEFPSEPFKGNVQFNKVVFRYPTRKTIPVLKNFDLKVKPGTSVALVGQSGCGKSTLIQLVQRFYDVDGHGPINSITLDGMDLRTLAPNWIRRNLAIVSQEPNLMDQTIRENIAYGLNHCEEISMDQIIEAAKQANAHSFIMDLPRGYETRVGTKGSQLSGGQRQRIAIARALIRNPRLLLLDEATSALDNESERVVQEALDKAMKIGARTTLVVAHRLTTVETCDIIVVLQDGCNVESGPPKELMESKGVYYNLNNADVNIKK